MCVYDLPRGSDWAYNVTRSDSSSDNNGNDINDTITTTTTTTNNNSNNNNSNNNKDNNMVSNTEVDKKVRRRDCSMIDTTSSLSRRSAQSCTPSSTVGITITRYGRRIFRLTGTKLYYLLHNFLIFLILFPAFFLLLLISPVFFSGKRNATCST